jgi:DNA end-binding protein Ku
LDFRTGSNAWGAVLTNRERPIALEPFGKGFRAITLRYPDEVRDEAESFTNIPDIRVPHDMRQLAEHIVETMATDFDLSWGCWH